MLPVRAAAEEWAPQPHRCDSGVVSVAADVVLVPLFVRSIFGVYQLEHMVLCVYQQLAVVLSPSAAGWLTTALGELIALNVLCAKGIPFCTSHRCDSGVVSVASG